MNDSTFINSKKTLEFNSPDGEKLIIPRGFIGSVPHWVTKTWLFQAACKDSTITFVGQSSNRTAEDRNSTELENLLERAKELNIKNPQSMKPETLKKKIEELEVNSEVVR